MDMTQVLLVPGPGDHPHTVQLGMLGSALFCSVLLYSTLLRTWFRERNSESSGLLIPNSL
jgi:hypothetical protein